MNSLRRIYSPGKERPRRIAAGQHPSRTGKAEARLEAALDQLRDGVPLNWSQLERDPEMLTLARLYSAAREARNQGLETLPPDLQQSTVERMVKRLPKVRQQAVRIAPTSLAGFSENVPVLTQVEDNISLRSKVPMRIAVLLVAGLLAVAAVVWAGNSFFAPPRSNLAWIDVLQNGKPVYAATLPANYKAPRCPSWTTIATSPYILRDYVPSPSKDKAQGNLDFPLEYLPASLVVSGTTYTLTYLDTAVAACEGPGSVPYSSAKLNYIARWNGPDGQVKLAPLAVFEGKRQRVAVDATQGKWKAVDVGSHKGVLWEGTPYKDTSGFDWFGDTIMLVVERAEIVTTIIGQASSGVTEGLLTEAVTQMAKASTQQSTAQYSSTSSIGTSVPGINVPIEYGPSKSMQK